MVESLSLLERLRALRNRLTQGPQPNTQRAEHASPRQRLLLLENQVAQLRLEHSRLNDKHEALETDQTVHYTVPAPNGRLAWRLRRLLLNGRGCIDQLKQLAQFFDHTQYQPDSRGPVEYFQQTYALAEYYLRMVEPIPNNLDEQNRLADGLRTALQELEVRIRALQQFAQRKQKWNQCIDTLAHSFQLLLNGRMFQLRSLQPLLHELLLLHEDHMPLVWLAPDKTRADRWAATVALNTTAVAIRLARQDAEWKHRLEDVALAAIVHDAGMAAMPLQLIQKQERYNEEDRRLLETHVGLAADALKTCVPTEGWLHDAIRSHHEHCDGTGYPMGLMGPKIPRLARLLAVSDMYAALSTRRPHRPSYSSRAALTETLLEAERGLLDMDIAGMLEKLTPYPIGSLVELSDGSIGRVVRHAHSSELSHRPLVLIKLTPEMQPCAGSILLDLENNPNQHIVRSLSVDEGQQLLGHFDLEGW